MFYTYFMQFKQRLTDNIIHTQILIADSNLDSGDAIQRSRKKKWSTKLNFKSLSQLKEK